MTEPDTDDRPVGSVSAALDSDTELYAIRAVLQALVPLKREGRTRVLTYVLGRLGMPVEASAEPMTNIQTRSEIGSSIETNCDQVDIRSLTKQKSPSSANEMAALVAYYLSEVAPEDTKKTSVNVENIKIYFKQAPFRLPKQPKNTLVNAKNAGYFEPAGAGQYRLNPVGYNLVVHGLPKSSVGPKRSKWETKRKQKRKS